MRDKSGISHEDFIAACCTVATVLGDGWWNSVSSAGEPVKRSAAGISAAMDCQTAAKYCGFGRTRFRQLVAGGVFPSPVTIEGRKRWLAKDLDTALVQLGRVQRRRGQ
jgi:predicted DNA-binding transcriptional regulator AlpA